MLPTLFIQLILNILKQHSSYANLHNKFNHTHTHTEEKKGGLAECSKINLKNKTYHTYVFVFERRNLLLL
jgi:hypothetical protein